MDSAATTAAGTRWPAAVLAAAACVTGHAGEILIEVHDQAGKPLPEAVAYAYPSDSAAQTAASATRGKIDQVDKQFVPQVTIVLIQKVAVGADAIATVTARFDASGIRR